MPTPAIAYLTRELTADAGVVISASHNPVEDNGIKFFCGRGFKLPDEVEDRIEALLPEQDQLPRPTGGDVGRVHLVEDAPERYLDYLAGLFPGGFAGMRIVIDCAAGAASFISPEIFHRLGAEVIPIFNKPNGVNINANCGSTHPQALQEAVVREGAQLGLAHDGDADRLLAVDERGQLVDGDQIMCICALQLAAEGKLAQQTLVATVMSNLGLTWPDRKGHQGRAHPSGGPVCAGGDAAPGSQSGGEQSGHIIFLDYNTTGDGDYCRNWPPSEKVGPPLSGTGGGDAPPAPGPVQYSASRKAEFATNVRVRGHQVSPGFLYRTRSGGGAPTGTEPGPGHGGREKEAEVEAIAQNWLLSLPRSGLKKSGRTGDAWSNSFGILL